MHWFFDETIRPLLDTVPKLRTMIEVGAEEGSHTSRLLPYAKSRKAHLHVIDPIPGPEALSCRRQFKRCSTLHQELSHDVLPSLDAPDVIFLDGDHNWYTVIEELRILDDRCADWPLTFLHDIEWPYARRDLYYAPEEVPDEYRQPYAHSGIVRGRSSLSPNGMNALLANATHEGGPRNGVLTAVEDFLGETSRDLVLYTVSGSNGLGILFDRVRLGDEAFAGALAGTQARPAAPGTGAGRRAAPARKGSRPSRGRRRARR